MNEKNTALKLLHDFSLQKKSVQEQLEHGIINYVDATNELNMITSKERKIKEKLVLEVHITEDGIPRKLKYLEAKDLWQTIMPDKSRVTAKTKELLIEKLFDWYHLKIQSVTVKDLFEVALSLKKRTENVNPDTINQNQYAYNRCITEDFGKRNITTITKDDLKEYTQNLVHRLDLTTNAFLEYKGVLNLIFDYAKDHDIISQNPVEAIHNSTYLKSCRQPSSQADDLILSEKEIELVIATVKKRMKQKRYSGYFINGYAILISIETGMRVGELCSLKWEDVKDNVLHIHSQQLNYKRKGGKEYYYAPWTKNEKGISKGGRKFPLTNTIRDILNELKELQDKMGICSEYVFCHPDGEWIKTDAYETCLRRLMQSLSFDVTNNHAFRKSLNTNVFIGKLQLPVTQRAKLLGHSVATNEKFYSPHSKDDDLESLRDLLNGADRNEVSPKSHPNLIDFKKVKSPESA